ncbi:MAG: lipid A biosynthesis acyltransferase [Gammaproteobacteria bacterium]|nr:lipid A biosynthesis acyltransferase [Gammaproteobacteria bacterium]
MSSSPSFSAELLLPKYWLSWIFLSLFFLFSLLPLSVIDSLARVLAFLSYRNNRKRVFYATRNLALCFPDKSDAEVEQLAKDHIFYRTLSLLHYGLVWWAPTFRLRQIIELQGAELLEAYRAQGKQVIALTSHSVGLEFAVLALSMNYQCSGPYNSLKNKVVDWLVARGRTRFGVRAYTREQGLRPLIKDTKNNRILIYLADEDLGAARSVFAPFFNVQKATVPVLGRLASQCNAVVMPCVSCYDMNRKKYVVKLLPAIELLSKDDNVLAATQMNCAIEQTVRECIAQYLWTLALFRTRPEGEASLYDP